MRLKFQIVNCITKTSYHATPIDLRLNSVQNFPSKCTSKVSQMNFKQNLKYKTTIIIVCSTAIWYTKQIDPLLKKHWTFQPGHCTLSFLIVYEYPSLITNKAKFFAFNNLLYQSADFFRRKNWDWTARLENLCFLKFDFNRLVAKIIGFLIEIEFLDWRTSSIKALIGISHIISNFHEKSVIIFK